MRIGAPIRRLLIAWLFVCLHALPSFAQTIDPNNNYCNNSNGALQGEFTLDNIRVCIDDQIRATAPLTLDEISYIPDYKGAGIPDNSLQLTGIFKYSTAGTYTILQKSTINGALAVKCRTVTVLPRDPVQFTTKACTGRQVTLQVNAATLGQYDTYVVSWGDGTNKELTRVELEANPQHAYAATSNNVRTITIEAVYGSLNNVTCSSRSSQQVALASDISQPVIQALTAVDNGTITLQYQVGAASPVQLYQKVNGSYVNTGQQFTGPATFTVKTDAKQVQCFKIISQDVCGSNSIPSDEVCSVVADAQATNKKNTVNWQAYAGPLAQSQFKNYQVIRNDAPLGAAIASQNTTTYSDTDVTCGTQYCYRLVATIGSSATATSTQTVITSAPACVTGISGTVPDNLGTVVVSVENNHPSIVTYLPTTGVPPNYTLVVSRADAGSAAFTPITTLASQTSYVDGSVDASTKSYCYQVTYQGGCGLELPPSQPACTILLTSSSIKSMDWTSASPFTPDAVTDYSVELIDSVSTREKSVGITTHYDRSPSEVVYRYRIIAKSGSYISYSNYQTFEREDRFTLPTAFTPNGDQVNDEFLPKGLYAERFLMHIYSRWGDVVYSTTDKTKGWDGMVNGLPASPGQYAYRIEVIDISNQTIVRTGAVLLIR
ncbi:gliding motility-associated C-terminal domain-containing protein [Spirosoma endophyticum]|uniref:Gliding motility-associated C-terminal domain-containing protein n=2 Tax=Spirosoma endophyticum TaxID=662367 RepID=A0A1I1RNH1_9BACT|nr:gliding motility-associated C-terminal domain-containing protein [Spirosoma endophyticum]